MPRANRTNVDLDFAFYLHLRAFYEEKRREIRSHYRELSRKFLDFNDPRRANKSLRLPQFEALEMYVFLKEFCDNKPVHQLFQDWYEKQNRFAGRSRSSVEPEQFSLFDKVTEGHYEGVFRRMRKNSRRYPNYIFALTMGTGKTILMATCIFYEFILANKYPLDEKYCHNALVFAPDKTVLQSLKEISEFPKSKVVPKEYVNWLETHLQFHFLEDAGTTLNLLDRSKYNIIVSNTQKIILKKQNKEKPLIDNLFGGGKATHEATPRNDVYDALNELLDEEPEDEAQLTTNQRFEKLKRLGQLGIYVDEAHHAFGNQLANDMGLKETATSLRKTIDELAVSLARAGTKVVACFNYTGTPYVGREVLPEVVYAYGLQEAIDKGLLKKVRLHGYANTRNEEFVQLAVDNFMAATRGADGFTRYEGMLPKLAFFAATIEELDSELRPAVEKALARHGLPASRILVNVGDPKLTTNDQIREFNRLDTPASEKQFILLVNKGREGWNCRSLFGVALFRQPKSKIFVLQATMRCLRAISETQLTGQVYLSQSNLQILDDELQQNFRISADELENAAADKETVQVRVLPPPVKIKLRRINRRFEMREKDVPPGFPLGLAEMDTEKYRLTHTQQEGLTPAAAAKRTVVEIEDITGVRRQRRFSQLTLVAEISRYLNRPCLEIAALLRQTQEGSEEILRAVNEFNQLLYDCVIPRLFAALYDLREFKHEEEHEVALIKEPPPEKGYYEVRAAPEKIVRVTHDLVGEKASKSFHLDAYCFDSNPEQTLFWNLLNDGAVQKVYFPGMFTHGQTDFFIQYIDPESHTVRSYYPDFLFQLADGSWVIVEVKGDNMIDDPIVKAKEEYAQQIAAASAMTYRIIEGSAAAAGHYRSLLTPKT